MDKRWRNLGILVLIVIIVALAVLYLPTVSLGEKKNIIDGYEALFNVFENSDVNIANVQTLNMEYFDENKGVVWVEPKANLLKAKTGLADFQKNLKDYSVEDKDTLVAAAKVYSGAIDFSFAEESRSKSISSLFSNPSTVCTSTTLASTLSALSTQSYNDRNKLATEVDDFSNKYDPYTELLSIDMEEAYSVLTLTNWKIADMKDACAGESA